MHTHNDEPETKAEMVGKLLDEYDIHHRSPITELRKDHIEKLLTKLDFLDKEECYFCGESSKYYLEEHHIVPKRYNGSNRDHNLVTLCRDCHRRLEELYTDKVFQTIAGQIEETKTSRETEFEKIDSNDIGDLV